MQNKVWDILKNQKEIYTEEGQKQIEQLHDVIAMIFEKVNKNDIRILHDGMCTKLFPTMDILEEYLKEENCKIEDKKYSFSYNCKGAVTWIGGCKTGYVMAKDENEARQKIKELMERMNGEVCNEYF